LLKHDRKALHRHVGVALERLYADDLDRFAALLAQHYAEAGEDSKTIEYATRAGDLAAHIYANAEAIAHYTQALAIARPVPDNSTQVIELFSKRGRALELMSQYDQVLANYDDMDALAQARGDRAMELAACMKRATIHSLPNAKFDPPQAQLLSDRSLALARELNDRPSEAKILWNLLLLAHFSGRPLDAIAYGEQSIALAREFGLREQLAYSLNDISRPYMMSNQIESGIAALTEARALWREFDNQPMLADNLNTLAMNNFTLGDYDRALMLTAEAYHIGETINNRWTQAHSLMTRSFIYTDRGEVERSLETLREGLRLAQEVGFRVAIVSTRTNLALTYASMGDVARGLEFVQPAQSSGEPSDGWQTSLLAIRAQLYVLQGDLDRARALVRQSQLGMKHELPSPFLTGATYLTEVELALAERDFVRVLETCDKFLAGVRERGMRFFRVYVEYLKARALDALERPDEAVLLLQEARAEAEQVGGRRNLWRILALLAEIEARRGNREQAAQLTAQARELIEFIAAHTPEEYRQSFLNLPHVRAVLA
jgi:tetratricopeptide (TPR) repeat protein